MEERYSRQVILPQFGLEGQEKLSKSRVAIIGCGALGSVVANTLARAGVGHIAIIDRDFVELNNLQRQVLFDEADVGRPKAIAACEKLKRINSSIIIEPVVKDVNHTNIESLIRDVDLILDGTDNFHTRFVVNDACVKHGIPWIYAAAIGTSGLLMPILPDGPCLRCLFPSPPPAGALPTCDTAGVLSTAPLVVAGCESTEAIQLLLGKAKESRLAMIDVWEQTFSTLEVEKAAECVCCGKREFEFLNAEKEEIITSLCGRNAIQITPATPGQISLPELAAKLSLLGEVEQTEYILVFRTDGKEISVFADGRAIIKGTDDAKLARSLYARYVGV